MSPILRYAAHAAVLLFLVLPAACTPDGEAMDKRTQRELRNKRLGVTPERRQQATGVAAADAATPSAIAASDSAIAIPFERRRGHVIKGTDLLLFIPCREETDYYLVGVPQVMPRINQRYKFTAPRPYAPMYIEVSARLVERTTTVGRYTYKRAVEVRELFPETQAPKDCPRPTRALVSATVARYD